MTEKEIPTLWLVACPNKKKQNELRKKAKLLSIERDISIFELLDGLLKKEKGE